MNDWLTKSGKWLLGIRTTNPMEARFWFNLRGAENWAIAIGIFIVLNAVLWIFLGGCFGSFVSIGLVFVFYFYVLERRTLGIECPGCKKYIETDTPWVCGYCGEKNSDTDNFPFIGRCRKCKAKPKAYRCHYPNCGKLIFFTKDEQETNYAHIALTLAKMKVARQGPLTTRPNDQAVTELTEQRQKLQRTKLEVEQAEWDIKLKDLSETLNPPKPKTHREILEEDASAFIDRHMSGAEIVARLKAKNKEVYKDNPAELAKQNAWVDEWAKTRFDQL